MERIISMSLKELDRYGIIQRVIKKEITGVKGADLLNLSYRQFKRLKNKVKENGAEGLIHGNRNKTSNRKIANKELKKIVKLLKSRYPDFGPTLAEEKLREVHEVKRDVKTIRSIMIKENLWKPKVKRKSSEYHAWRKPKDMCGEMEQFDGSYHDWFEGRLKNEEGEIVKPCLLVAVDDAQKKIVKAKFGPHEGIFPVFSFWQEYIENEGKPRSIYLDKFSTYRMNSKAAKADHELKTQFQRAMIELKIEPIFANSPQAKGRVERVFGTLQDRLIKEMRLEKISTIEKANKFLEEKFIGQFNAKFAKEAAKKGDLHQKLKQCEKKKIESIFSKQTDRVVQNDFTISFNNTWFQLEENQPVTVCKKDKVVVEERVNGSVWIRLRGKYLNYKILKDRNKADKSNKWVINKTIVAEKKKCPLEVAIKKNKNKKNIPKLNN